MTLWGQSLNRYPPLLNSCSHAQDGGAKAEQGGGQFTDAGPGLVTPPPLGIQALGGAPLPPPRGTQTLGGLTTPSQGSPGLAGELSFLSPRGVFVCLGVPGGSVGRGRRGYPTPPPHSPVHPAPHAPLPSAPCGHFVQSSIKKRGSGNRRPDACVCVCVCVWGGTLRGTLAGRGHRRGRSPHGKGAPFEGGRAP